MSEPTWEEEIAKLNKRVDIIMEAMVVLVKRLEAAERKPNLDEIFAMADQIEAHINKPT